MCGRYGLYDISDEEVHLENKGYKFKPNYNVSPSQTMPVIVAGDEGLEARLMRWGIPRVVGPQIEKEIINTRSDKAFERFWGNTVRHFRCLIPANGFYEWRRDGKEKTPYWIHPTNTDLFHFAGIYQKDADGHYSYSIMTTEPNKEMKGIHNRMPVILPRSMEERWLGDRTDQVLGEMLHPLPDDSLEIEKVSKEVNSPRNNYKELIRAVRGGPTHLWRARNYIFQNKF